MITLIDFDLIDMRIEEPDAMHLRIYFNIYAIYLVPWRIYPNFRERSKLLATHYTMIIPIFQNIQVVICALLNKKSNDFNERVKNRLFNVEKFI